MEAVITVGDIYEDCAFHPVLCTRVSVDLDGDAEVTGISLIDGSYPRSCSMNSCGPVRMTVEEATEAKMSFVAYVARRRSESNGSRGSTPSTL